MPNKSSFLLLSVALYIINTRNMYYIILFLQHATYTFIPICSKSLYWIFYFKYSWKVCNTITMLFLRTNFYYINTNEKPGKLLLKTWLNHCWYGWNYVKLCLPLQKNINKVKWFIHFIGVYSVYQWIHTVSNFSNLIKFYLICQM